MKSIGTTVTSCSLKSSLSTQIQADSVYVVEEERLWLCIISSGIIHLITRPFLFRKIVVNVSTLKLL